MKRKLLSSAAISLLFNLGLLGATAPATLNITGTALAEAETLPMKLTDNVFELYTSLKAGDYSFTDETTGGNVNEDGTYRIRVDYTGEVPAVSLEKIERVYLWAPWNKFTIADLTYAGNSTFHAEQITYNKGKWGDDRYRIRIEFEEGRYETYAKDNSKELVRATDGQWGGDSNGNPEQNYKVTGDYATGKTFNVDVFFQVDDVYTHELTDYIAPVDPSLPEALSVKGTALAETEEALSMKLVSNNVFELYTSLKAGEYGFEGDETLSTQTITAEESTPYRIQVDYNGESPVIKALPIEKMYAWAPYSGKTLFEISYIGNSIFQAENIICPNGDEWFGTTGWGEKRYRIRIEFTDGTLETYGPKDDLRFVSVGNEDWGASDHNYELADKYRNEQQAFNLTVKLSATEDYDCSVSDYTGGTTGLNQTQENEVLIYPTLIANQVKVSTDLDNFSVELISVSGATLLKQEGNSHEAILNTSDLSNGIYLLKVTQGNELIKLQKLIKH